jgi:hypothetical protein
LSKNSEITHALKQIEELNSEEIEKCQDVLLNCSEGTIYNDINLFIHSIKYFPECNGFVGFFYWEDSLVAYLLYAQCYSSSDYQYYSPYQKSLIPYGGIVINDNYSNNGDEIIKLFKNSIRETFNLIYIKSNPGIDERPYLREKFKIKAIPTLIINLDKSEKDLWESFENRIRRNIKKAEKQRIKINIITPTSINDIGPLTIIYKELCDLKGLSYYSDEYYFEILQILNKNHGTRILYAIYKGQIISAMSVCLYKNTINPWFGGTLKEFVHTEAGTLIYWEIIKYGSKNGYKKFDFLGLDIGPIAFYKKGFGGTEVPVYHLMHSSLMLKLKNRLKKWHILKAI